MPSTVEKLAPTRVKLTIEIPFADLKPHLDRAYKQIAEQVTVPGFRKGKVPAAVIDQRFGRGAVLQDAINEALPGAYSTAITEHELVPLGQPEVDVTKLEDGDVVEFTAEVDVRPEFDIPESSTLSAQVPTLAGTEAGVDERVEVLRQRFATRTDV
ncbi:MAG: trigger factor, partial [Propioniciclava sp.]